MAELFMLLDVGPLGIDANWPASLRFYDKLPEWAKDWETVAIHAAHGEGRAYVFSLVGGDFAFESDKTVLVGESLLALETEEFRSRKQRIAALEAENKARQEFIESVAWLFDKLAAEAESHPARIAEITQERCRDFAANARAALKEAT